MSAMSVRESGRVRVDRARWRCRRAAAAGWGRVRRRGRAAGMTTAEYAVGTVAAVAFAVVLYKIVTSSAVSEALGGIVRRALHAQV